LNNLSILKIGGSILTSKTGIRKEVVGEMVEEIGKALDLDDRLILIHGAGSYGHPQAKKYHLDREFNRRGMVETMEAVRELNRSIVSELNSVVDAVSFHPFNLAVTENGRIIELFDRPLKMALENGLIPVLHGDVVFDTIKRSCILSGDQLTCYLAKYFGAGRVGFASDVEGVLDRKGEVIPILTPDHLSRMASSTSDRVNVTGEMQGKVRECIIDYGISAVIFSGRDKDNLEKFFRDEPIGTKVLVDAR